MRNIAGALLASSLELWGGVVWINQPGSGLSITLHLIAAFLLGLMAWSSTKGSTGVRLGTLGMVVAVPLFVPVIGVICLCTVAVYRSRDQRRTVPARWQYTTLPDLPSHPRIKGSAELPGDLSAIVRHARTSDRRVQALLKTRRWLDVEAAPLLTRALRDTADEVRLLAYTLLKDRERIIYDRIKDAEMRLATSQGIDVSPILRRLIRDQWQLVRAGFAQGAVRLHVLHAAQGHVDRAITLRPTDGALHLLRGRLSLELGDSIAAEQALTQALDLDEPEAAAERAALRRTRTTDLTRRPPQRQAAQTAGFRDNRSVLAMP